LRGQNRVRFLSAPGAKFGQFCPNEAQLARKVKSGLTASQTGNCRKRLEARVGIEPTHKGFADLSLTTWVPRPAYHGSVPCEKCPFCGDETGSGVKSGAPAVQFLNRLAQIRALLLRLNYTVKAI
jgi:hypothetical protein